MAFAMRGLRISMVAAVSEGLQQYSCLRLGKEDRDMSFQFIGFSRKNDLDAPVVYDIDKMNQSLSSGELRVPKGLSREERRRFVRESRANAARG